MKTKSAWTVGELARAAGTTVRALHHYEALGLLAPRRSASNHRLYNEADARRLQNIQLLKRLDLPLDQIRTILDSERFDMAQLLEAHRRRLRDRMARLNDALAQVENLERHLRRGGAADLHAVFSLLEALDMFEQHYTPEQLEELARRRESLGEEGMRKAQQEWQDLIGEVRAAVANNTPPDSETGRTLAARWQALIAQFTGGNPGIRQSLDNAYDAHPEAWEQFGIDAAMREWMGKACGGA